MFKNLVLNIVLAISLVYLGGCKGGAGDGASSGGAEGTATAGPSPVSALTMSPTHNSNSSTPTITWIGSPSSNVLRYEYCIGISAGTCTLLSWTSNSLNTSLTVSGLSLTNGQKYFVNVRAVDNIGNTSSIVSSSWTVDMLFSCVSIHNYNSVTGNSGELYANPTSGIYGYINSGTLRRYRTSDSSDTLLADTTSLAIVNSWSLNSWTFDRVTGDAYALIKSDMTRRVRGVDLLSGNIDSTIPDFSISATYENSLENKIDVKNGKIIVASHYKKINNSAGYLKVNTYVSSWNSSFSASYLPSAVSVTLFGVNEFNTLPVLTSGYSYNGGAYRWTTNGSGALQNGNNYQNNDDFLDPNGLYNYFPVSMDVSNSQMVVAGSVPFSGGVKTVVRSFSGITWGTLFEYSVSGLNYSPVVTKYSINDSSSSWLLIVNSSATTGASHKVVELNADSGALRREISIYKPGSYKTMVSDIYPISKDEMYALATVQETNGGDKFIHIYKCSY